MRAPRNNPWKAPIIPEEEGRQRESEGGRSEDGGRGGGGRRRVTCCIFKKQTTSHTYSHIMTYPRYTHNITHCVDNTDSLKGVYRVSTGWGGMCLSYPW